MRLLAIYEERSKVFIPDLINVSDRHREAIEAIIGQEIMHRHDGWQRTVELGDSGNLPTVALYVSALQNFMRRYGLDSVPHAAGALNLWCIRRRQNPLSYHGGFWQILFTEPVAEVGDVVEREERDDAGNLLYIGYSTQTPTVDILQTVDWHPRSEARRAARVRLRRAYEHDLDAALDRIADRWKEHYDLSDTQHEQAKHLVWVCCRLLRESCKKIAINNDADERNVQKQTAPLARKMGIERFPQSKK